MSSKIVTLSLVLLSAVSIAAMPLPVLAAPPSAASSPAAADEVGLVAGGFVKGEIVEYTPGAYVVIVPVAGEPRRISWVDISQVVRNGNVEWIASSPTPAPIQPTSEAEVEASEPEGPAETEPEGTRIHIDQMHGSEPVYLHRIDGEAVAAVGGYVASAVAYTELCASPCDITLERAGGEFFVAGRKYRASKRFRLTGNAPRYDLSVKPGSKGLAIGGYFMAIVVPSLAVGLAGLPLATDMPMARARGVWVGAGFLFAAGLGGGIAMMVHSRTKVRVIPRR